MKKKVLKSFYCMAVMLLTLGTLSFIPALKSDSAMATEVAEGSGTSNAFNDGVSVSAENNFSGNAYASIEDSGRSQNKWNSQFDNMTMTEIEALAATVENTTKPRPDGLYHVISSVDDLALVSYQILSGNTTWAAYNYELTSSLDLSGALWTPIGTQSNPFVGKFYGGNNTITNISVSTLSTTSDLYAGLFGRTQGAKISNLIIEGFKFSDSSNLLYAGGLIGYAGANTVVANVYMYGSSDILNGIGYAADSTVKVYRGGSRDGQTAHCTTTAAIQNAFLVGSGSPTYGYAVSYIHANQSGASVSDAKIVKYSSQTSWNNAEYIYPTYGTLINTSGNIDSFNHLMYGDMPKSRVSAMASLNGNFTIREGYSHTFSIGSTSVTSFSGNVSSLISNGMIAKIVWTEKNFNVDIHYGYNKNNGDEKVVTRSVPNDALWTTAVTDASLTRVGYTIDGKYFNSNRVSDPMDGSANRCYVGDGAGFNNGKYSLYLTWTAKTDIAYNVDLTNVTSDNGFNPTNAVTGFAIKEGSEAVSLTTGTTYDYDLTGHTSSNTVTITFKLNWGYVFNVGSGYTINSTVPAMETSGVYLVFGSGNYDVDAKTTYNIEATGNNYTITLTNLVGSGQIYLAFDRAEQTVGLVGQNVNWSLSGNTDKTYIDGDSLKTRVGEGFSIKATSINPEDFFITTYETSGIINTNGSSISGTGSDIKYNHYTVYEWGITSFNSNMSGSETMYIKALAGTLEVNINVSIIHDPDTYNGFTADATHASAGASVVGSNNTTNSTTPATYRASLKNGAVEVFMISNAYYKYSNLVGSSTNSESVVFTEIETEQLANGYIKYKASFNPVIEDNEGTPTYTVTFTAVPQEYSLTSEIYIDGSLVIDEVTLNKYFTNYKSGDLTSQWAGHELTGVNFTLNDLGNNVLVFDSENSGVVAKTENTPGSIGTLDGDTYTYGTRDSVIKMYYKYKTATINLTATAYVEDVNGEAGTDVEWSNLINGFLDSTGAGITSLTGTINPDGTAVSFSAGVGSVNIVNGYYFLGWYLRNGEVITKMTSNRDMTLSGLTTGALLDLLQSATEVETVVSFGPIIKQKTVNLTFVEGEDVNGLISYKNDEHKTDDGSKVIATSYIYYHNQETFSSDSGVYGNKTAFSFKANYLDQLFKKIGANNLTGYSVEHNGQTTLFLDVNNNNFTTTNFEVSYGAEGVTLEFTPIFADLLSYEITIGNNVNGDKSTLNISLGDTIVMSNATNNGAVTYQIVREDVVISEVTTSTVVGYSAVDSKLFTFAGNSTKSEKVNSFVLGEDVIKTYLPTTDYYVGGTNPFVVETQLNPINYKIYLNLNSTYETLSSEVLSEEDGRIYVEATYDKIMDNLQKVNVVRKGYVIDKWINSLTSDVVLEKNEGVWKDTLYKYDNNITVKPVWIVDTDNYYINIDSIVGGEVYYNGQLQEVASVTLSTDTNDEVPATRNTLANGDIITSQYWAKKGDEDNAVQSNLTLSLTNVVESGEYVYVINVQSVSGLNADGYRIISDGVTVNIKKNTIEVADAALKGFYTGSADYIATEDSVVGTLNFGNKNTTADGEIPESILTVTGFEFIDASNAFDAKSGYAVRYYIDFNGNENNFTGFVTADDGRNYIIINNVGEIVKTKVVFAVAGKGLYADGMIHEVSYTATNPSVDFAKYGIDATAKITTKGFATGSYTDDAGFDVVNFNAKIGDKNVTNNFEYSVTGTYIIEQATTVYNYTVEYLTASNGSINGLLPNYSDAEYVLNITAITLGGVAITDFNNSSFYSHTIDGNVALTIFGNGSSDLSIAVNSLYNVGITVQATAKNANGNLVFLGYFEGNQNYQTLINEFANPASTSTVVNRVEGMQNFFAVFTDVKAVTLDKGNSNEIIYISAGETGLDIDNPNREGLTFTGWNFTDGSVTKVEGKEQYKFVVNAGSKPATATANWELQTPTVEKTGQTITKTASETTQNISLEEVIGRITNINNASIEYSYTWKKGDEIIEANAQSLSFDKLTTENAGDYTLVITATFEEQNKTCEVPFTVVVNRVKITSYTLSSNGETYNNSNFASTVKAILVVGGTTKEFNLSTSLTAGQAIYFTINGDQTIQVLKDVASYAITLNVDETIYELALDLVTSQTFEISKATYTLSDFVLTKNFGSKTPEFKTTVNVNGENITINFTPITSEEVGRYELSLASVSSGNYTVVLKNCIYEILKLSANLRVSLNGTFSMVYNGKTITSIDKELVDGKWVLVAKDSDGNQQAIVNITLYYENDEGSNVEVTTNIESALDGFTFNLASAAKNAGNYALSASGTSSTYGGIELYGAETLRRFVIEQSSINVTALEKKFDESANFTWSSTQTSGNTTIVANGIVAGDNVTISGSLAGITVGTHNITSISLTDESGNYRLVNDHTATTGTIVASDAIIALDGSVKAFDYGTINETNSTDKVGIMDLLKLALTANGAESNSFNLGYVTIESVSIGTAADYSTGRYLKAGKHIVTITLSSLNYTNANGEFTVEIDVNKVGINLTSTTVTKEYDGNTTLPASVNWIKTGMLENDIVDVQGSFASSEIGSKIALNLILTGADADNYSISAQPTGSITSTAIKFTANLNTITFVDGNEFNPGTIEFSITYNGDKEVFLSALAQKFVERVGYTQTGWAYGENIVINSSNFATFLAEAIAANLGDAKALELNAVWGINKLTIAINSENATVKVGGTAVTSLEINYYDSVTFVIEGNEGYRYSSYNFSGLSESVTDPVGVTNNETLTLNNITSAGTVTINMVEIQITVKVDLSLAPEAANASAEWTTQKFGYNAAKGAALNLLPKVSTTEGTYLLDYWMKDTTKVEEETTLLSLVDGEINADKTITIVANFKPVDLKLTILHEHADVTVKIGDDVITGVESIYDIYYDADLVITINGHEGFKYTSETHEGIATSFTPDGVNNINASLAVSGVKGNLTVTLNMAEIQVTLKAENNTVGLVNTSVMSQWTEKTFDYSQLKGSVNTILTDMTVTAGTYTQEGWTLDGVNVTEEDLLTLVKNKKGEALTEDYTLEIAFKPVWKGVKYSITFDKNSDEATLVGNNPIEATYGETITGMPVASRGETTYSYVWNTLANGEGTPYSTAGSVLRTIGTPGETGYTLTLYAVWTERQYTLTITKDDNVLSYLVNGETIAGDSITVGATEIIEITVTFKNGYEVDTTSTTLTNGTINFVNGNIKLSDIGGNSTLNIVSKASTYKLVFETSDFETVTGGLTEEGKTYVEVVYGEALSDQLNGVIVARDGYVFKGFTANGNNFASYNAGVYTFTDSNYLTAGDTTLKAVWEAEDDYFEITLTTPTAVTYNGKNQDFVTASVTGVILTNKDLSNGDEIVDYYFEKVVNEDGNNTYIRVGDSTTNILTLKNVIESGNYVFVLVIKDSTTGQTRIVRSSAVNVVINKAELGWSDDAILESYYTGTTTFTGTSANVNGAPALNGELTSDAAFVRFEFVNEENVVGSNYDVHAYITIGASLLENYSNILGDASNGYYILLENIASVKESPITITAKGQGFFTGDKQVASYDVATTVNGLNLQDFNIQITLTTKDSSVGKKTEFDASNFSVTKNGKDVTSSFAYSVAGEYTILDAINASTMTISREVLTNGEANVNSMITLSGVKLNGNNVAINGEFYNHLDSEGNVIFSISGNGKLNSDVVVVVNSSYTLSFTATVGGNFAPFEILTWANEVSESANKEILKNLTSIESRSKEMSVTEDSTIYYVLTDLKAINVDLGDEGSNEYVYAKLDAETAYADPTWTGFDFAGYNVVTGVTAADGKISVDRNASILPAKITARWNIAKPNAVAVNDAINIVTSEGNSEIAIEDVIATFENKNADELTYIYEWFNSANESLGTGDKLSIPANTNSVGSYYVIITAAKSGYASVSSDKVEFNITATKSTLSASTTASETYTYANKDFADEISITLTINGETSVKTLKELINGESIKALINGGIGEIKNQGSYVVTLWSDSTIYDMTAFTVTFTVNKMTHTITEEETSELNKFFGEDDPALEINLTLNDELVKVEFTREEGEEVGNYKLSIKEGYNDNYSFEIASDNKYFEIKKSEGILRIEVVAFEEFVKEYNKKNTVFTAIFADGKWTLYAFNEGDNINDKANAIASSELKLYTLISGNLSPLGDAALPTALAKTTFAIEGDNFSVGLYTITAKDTNYAQVAFTRDMKFEVTKASLTITSVSKVFDKTTEFSSANGHVAFTGIVGDDSVVITGNFASANAGTNIDLVFDELLGNYVIKNPEIKGTISPSNEEVNINLTPNFTYGDIKKDSNLSDTLGVTVSIGDYLDAVADGYVTIESIEIIGGGYSSTNNLKANNYTVKFTLKSTNYAKADGEKTFQITVSKIEIDLRGVSVSKVYDGNTTLPTVEWNLNDIIVGDKVGVSGAYEDEKVGTDKNLLLTLTGVDAENYDIAYKPNGTITSTSVRLNVDAETLANFVNDGEVVNLPSTVFDVAYPTADDADLGGILNSLTYPTRTGYEVEYWSYRLTSGEASGYERITVQNINTVLNLAFSQGGITIYANWKIKQVEVEINVENATVEVATAGVVKNENGKYVVDYFSSLDFNVLADTGYKFTGATVTSGNVVGGVTTDGIGTRKDGTFNLSNIKTNSVIAISTEEISITIKVEANVLAGTSLENIAWTEKTLLFSQTDTEVIGLLPNITVTAGTYLLNGFSTVFGESTINLPITSTDKLMSILGNELNEDTTITFSAVWKGENYTIYFDKNNDEAEITNGVTSITAEYGKAMNETFAEAVLAGKENVWNTQADGEGDFYKQGDELFTIGTAGESGYTLTLFAIWSNGKSTVKVEFTDSEIVSVVVAGETISSGEEYTLVYGVQELNVTVTTESGYTFLPTLTNESDGKIEINPKDDRLNTRTITLSNLSADSVLTISAKALDNVLSITTQNAEITNVTNGEFSTERQEVVASTGKEVTIEFKANEGYTFDQNSVVEKTGSGNITRSYSSGKLILTWSGFTANASLNVIPTANVNTITLSDSSKYVDKLVINGTSLVAGGDSITATTGTSLTINVTLKYGYVNSNIEINDSSINFVSGEEVWNDSIKAYTRTFTIDGFTTGFSFKVTAEAREYTFESNSKNPAMGSVNVSANIAKFGESITLNATPIASYRFGGWYIGENLISTANPYTFQLNETNKEALESGAIVSFLGEFTLDETIITISSGAKGSLTYTVNGENEVSVATNSSVTRKFKYGNTLEITPKADRGYIPEVVFYDAMGNEIADATWFDEESGLITILLEVDAPSKIEVKFVAGEAIIKVTTAVQINYQLSYGTDIGGTIYLSDSVGNIYTTSPDYVDVIKEGVDYSVKAMTDSKKYFVVHTNSGYTMTLSSPTLGVIINQTPLANGDTLFEISGIVDSMALEAIFVAKDNMVRLFFVNEDEQAVPAGSISVATAGYIAVSGNNSPEVQVSAITDSSISITAYTNLSYEFVKDGAVAKVSVSEGFTGVTVDSIIDVVNVSGTGFTQSVKLSINKLDRDCSIYIYAEPKRYNLQFISNGYAMSTVLNNVVYGQELPAFDSSSILPESRADYLFKGYYTKELGQGTQYIDEFGNPTQVWLETGYTWNGVEYQLESGLYNKERNTFSLYAAWYYSKEKITLSFLPEGLENTENVTIADIVKPVNSQTPWWSTGDNLFYAEVPTNAKMILSAYEFDGYTFDHWLITREGEEALRISSPTYEYESKTGDVFIKAVYFANFNLEVYDNGIGEVDGICGQASLMQEGVNLGSSGKFDTTKNITLVATENAGYKFYGWLNTATGEYIRDEAGNLILGEYNNRTYRYTFPELISQPFALRAVFEGAEIGIMIDMSEFSAYGRINGIRINGNTVAWASEIEARVGDTIEIDITTNYGYGVTWSGPIFTGMDGVYSYRIYARDLTVVPGSIHESVLVVKPVANPHPITYVMELQVEGSTNSGELELVGSLVYREDGSVIKNGSIISTLFGRTVYLNVNMNANYKVGEVRIVVAGISYDISNTYLEAQQQIVLTSDILERYQVNGEARIVINYARLLWTDFRSEGLTGEGTQANPFTIASCEDMAFVAYAVNNGLVSESGLAYTDAYYNVTTDLNFAGKFWIPIGTQTHYFNGIINLNSYNISGITHYMTYTPSTYHEGLIWFMTERAQVLRTNNTLTIALSVVGGILLLLILIIIIIVIVRKRKKKKMDELANG